MLETSDESHLDTQVDLSRRGEAVRLALEGRPEEQLSLVRPAIFDGLSHSEISERTGLPLATVKSRLRLGFVWLRHAPEARGAAEAS